MQDWCLGVQRLGPPSLHRSTLPSKLKETMRKANFFVAATALGVALWSSGAPSVLYPLYVDAWGLSTATITAVFATYPLALIAALLIFGNLSDAIGRRVVMMWGIALIAGSALLFALAPNVGLLFAGRIFQGAGSGLAIGAAGAALVEHNPSTHARYASASAAVANSTGLTASLVAAGALVQFVPFPLVVSYVLLLALSLGTLVALAMLGDDRPVSAPRWRPAQVRLVPELRLPFAAATLSVALAYCVGAIFLSIGALMIKQFSPLSNVFTTGLILGSSSAAIGVTALMSARLRTHIAVYTGAVLTLTSLAVMAVVSVGGSLAVFLVWCVIGGAGYSCTFTGGLGLINNRAPIAHRGATMSSLYLVVYVLQAGTALGVGAVAASWNLTIAVLVAVAALTVMTGTVVLLTWQTQHRS